MPFFWITTLFIIGILISSGFDLVSSVWVIILGGSVVISSALLVAAYKKISHFDTPLLTSRLPNTRLPVVLLPVFILLGGAAYQLALPNQTRETIYSYNDRGNVIEIRGRVVELPDIREKLTLVEIQADAFRVDSQETLPVSERLMVFLSPGQTVKYGDSILLSGKPITPRNSADFSYRDYLSSQGIFTQLMYPKVLEQSPSRGGIADILFRFKEKSLSLVDVIFPSPEGSLVKGILLGDDNDIPAALSDSFRRSGTSHLIAISGFNIAIVANLVTLLFAGIFGKWRGALGAIVAITLYTILVGANPPVVRAAIMGSIGILGILIGRRSGGINALFLTCGLMLLNNPFLLWSVSFQLSAGATLGLVLYASPIQQWVEEFVSRTSQSPFAKKAGKWISEYVFFTIAAQIPIIPILLHYFHQVPMATLIANPLVLPLQPPLMILSAVALGLAWINPALGSLAANLCLPLITLTIRVVEWAAGLDLPSLTSPTLSFGLIGAWLLVISLPAALPTLEVSLRRKWKPAILTGIVGFVALSLIHYAIDRRIDGNLHVYISGNSTSPAILLRTPGGRTLLVDTGGSVNELLSFIDSRTPFASRRLDAVFLLPTKYRKDVLQSILPIVQVDEIYAMGVGDLPGCDFNSSLLNQNCVITPGGASYTSEDDLTVILAPASDDLQHVQVNWKQVSLDLLFGKSQTPVSCSGGIVLINGPSIQIDDGCQPQVLLVAGQNNLRSNQINLSRTGWLHLSSDGANLWLEFTKMSPNHL